MIEKIKYELQRAMASKQMRLIGIAILTAITAAVITLLNCSVNTFKVFDGEKNYIVRTLSSDVEKVLSNLSLKSQDYTIESTIVDGKTTKVDILYNFPVYIVYGDKTLEVSVCKGTVGDAIKKAGFTVDEFDFIEPALDTNLTKNQYIDFTDINYVSGVYTESIPYMVQTLYSPDTEKGVKKTITAGVNGLREISYTEKIVNGVSVEKTVTGSTVVAAAVNAKEVIGTKVTAGNGLTNYDVNSISVLNPPFTINLDANGNPTSYVSKMTVRATAYTYTGNNCSTGVAPKPGYIAVNPKVIPYGTKMYIKSPDGSIIYGYAVAADTGGFIKKYPTGVDLFMATRSACVNFGVRNMEIYILE